MDITSKILMNAGVDQGFVSKLCKNNDGIINYSFDWHKKLCICEQDFEKDLILKGIISPITSDNHHNYISISGYLGVSNSQNSDGGIISYTGDYGFVYVDKCNRGSIISGDNSSILSNSENKTIISGNNSSIRLKYPPAYISAGIGSIATINDKKYYFGEGGFEPNIFYFNFEDPRREFDVQSARAKTIDLIKLRLGY